MIIRKLFYRSLVDLPALGVSYNNLSKEANFSIMASIAIRILD